MHSKPPLISDGLRAKFQAIATETAELVPPSAYANYVIIDPTTADPEGILPGAAIYVGQTSELKSRIRSHLRQAIRPTPEHAQLYHYMARLIGRGTWPLFRVLETHTNRIDCMLAETVWAQRLLRSGARLFNTWPEQSRILTKSSLRRMQRARLFLLSLKEAEAVDLHLQIACRAGCYVLTAAPKDLAVWFGHRITLKGVRERTRRCPECGGQNRYALVNGGLAGVPDEVMAELTVLPEIYPRDWPRKPENLRLFGYADRGGPRKLWAKACKAAGIEQIPFHPAGRHGFGQEMNVREKVDEKAAGAFGGWSDLNLMRNTYTHAEDTETKINEALRRGLVKAEIKTKLKLRKEP